MLHLGGGRTDLDNGREGPQIERLIIAKLASLPGSRVGKQVPGLFRLFPTVTSLWHSKHYWWKKYLCHSESASLSTHVSASAVTRRTRYRVQRWCLLNPMRIAHAPKKFVSFSVYFLVTWSIEYMQILRCDDVRDF